MCAANCQLQCESNSSNTIQGCYQCFAQCGNSCADQLSRCADLCVPG
jgi:hypothetical protein